MANSTQFWSQASLGTKGNKRGLGVNQMGAHTGRSSHQIPLSRPQVFSEAWQVGVSRVRAPKRPKGGPENDPHPARSGEAWPSLPSG